MYVSCIVPISDWYRYWPVLNVKISLLNQKWKQHQKQKEYLGVFCQSNSDVKDSVAIKLFFCYLKHGALHRGHTSPKLRGAAASVQGFLWLRSLEVQHVMSCHRSVTLLITDGAHQSCRACCPGCTGLCSRARGLGVGRGVGWTAHRNVKSLAAIRPEHEWR